MADIIDVANYILEISREESPDDDYDLITPMKLQKLVYFCQGYFLALNGTPLFSEPIEAWDHGPVCPTLYHLFKRYGSSPLVATIDPKRIMLSELEKHIIGMVYNSYKQYSPSGLRNITHREGPWSDTRKNTIIHPEAMLKYFESLIEVNPADIPLSTDDEKNELITILEKAETDGEINLSQFRIPVGA